MPPQNHHKTSGMLLAPFLMGTLLACLASCGDEGNGPASQAPASSATKTIRNSEFRFTIQVPSNWRVDERPPVPPGSRVFRPLIEAVSSSDIRAVLQVRCGPKVPAEATSEAIAKEIAQGHLSHNRSLRVTHGTGRVSGREVWWTDTVTPGEDWRHRAYWLIVRSTVFEVAVSSTDSGFAGVEPLLTRIVESMQFD